MRQIYLIFKTHLDIGFTGYASDVTATYFADFLPRALAVAETMRSEGDDRFVWTTGSWLIATALERARGADRRAIERAIERGDLTWHALPFTTHTELLDAGLLDRALGFSRELDARFGRQTIAAKMTDVPGHTRAIVGPLAASGIRMLHIGVNAASAPPDVPDAFRWRDPDGAEIVVVYQKGGYGDLTLLDGMDDALLFAHTNDNHGPQTAEQVRETFAHARAQFPDARVRASTMDAFAAQIWAAREQLPTITQEIGDTWIHGVGTDPAKVAGFRALTRLRRQWLGAGATPAEAAAIGRMSTALLLVAEHTWGMDEKTFLNDYVNYTPAQLAAVRLTPAFVAFAASWVEQRGYLDAAVAELAAHPSLATAAAQALADLRPDPATPRATATTARQLRGARLTIELDRLTGAIVGLTDRRSGRSWADAAHPIGLLRYQSFDEADYRRWWWQYGRNPEETASWGVPDQTKPGIDAAGARAGWWGYTAEEWLAEGDERLHVWLRRDPAADGLGMPGRALISVALADESTAALTVQWFDKPASRLPEAIWLSCAPRILDRRGWTMTKIGRPIDPLDVVRNGGRHLHAVESLTYRDDRGALALESLDAPLVAPGAPQLLWLHNRQLPMHRGVHFNLYNNAWGTNFPMWYDEDARFHVLIRLT